jgi:hypothetical protein
LLWQANDVNGVLPPAGHAALAASAADDHVQVVLYKSTTLYRAKSVSILPLTLTFLE